MIFQSLFYSSTEVITDALFSSSYSFVPSHKRYLFYVFISFFEFVILNNPRKPGILNKKNTPIMIGTGIEFFVRIVMD